MRAFSWILSFAFVVTMGGPAMATGITAETLDGTSWTLADLPPEPLLDNVTPTLAFEAGQVAGTDGCNRFRGTYTIEGAELRIGQLAGTMMACPEPVMLQGQRFTAALESSRGAVMEDSVLVLVDADGQPLARLEAQTQSLADTRWGVTGYNNGRQAVVSTLGESDLTLAFDGAGTVAGSAGCNSFRASYSEDGGVLRIGPPATGRRLCAEDLMAQETAFLEALGRSTTHRIEGDRLEMRDDKGALQVTARRSE